MKTAERVKQIQHRIYVYEIVGKKNTFITLEDAKFILARIQVLTTALESILLESSWPLVKGIACRALEDGEG